MESKMFGITEDGTYRVESIGFSTPELTEGYVVAVQPVQREADIPTTETLFSRWTDAETDTVYWDEVEVIDDLLGAIATAYYRGELAIWDVANNEEIRVAEWLDLNS